MPTADIEYRAAPGEVNRVEITRLNDQAIRVSDSGAVIAAGEQCAALDAHTAICTTAAGQHALYGADVQAGDMDDLVTGRLRQMSADGGPGDDRLVMSRGNATLNGGGGRDALVGGPGGDTLVDGDTSAAKDADLLDGGDGSDSVSYEARTQPVRVDPADAAPDGEAGEGDVVRSV